MRDRFSEATKEQEKRSAFECDTCEPHTIGVKQDEKSHGYDIDDGLERLKHDPSPAGV